MTGIEQPPALHTTAEKLAELHARIELAKEPGGDKAAAKRDKKGIPSARARVHALVDPGTFLEIGALAKTPNDPNALYGDGVVTGHALIDGRPVGVFCHDQTVFQGTVGEMFGRKVARLMEWCAMVGCPIIGIQDSGGARIQDAVDLAGLVCRNLGAATNCCRESCRRSPSSSVNAQGARSIRRSRTISLSRCAIRATSLSPVRT